MERGIDESNKKPRLDTRARQRLELKALRKENEELLSERAQLLEKIQSLETASKPQTKQPEELKVAAENDLLRTELEQHKQLMKSFNSLLGEQPVSLEAEHVIYGEGAGRYRLQYARPL